MVVTELQLARGAEHAVALLAADLAGLQRDAGAGNVAAGRREDALHAGARVRRAAHDLDDHAAGIDLADAQAVGVGMLHRLDHVAHDEGLEGFGRIGQMPSTSRPSMVSVSRTWCERRVGVEMLLEPGQGEFHRPSPPVSEGVSSAEKP
jgi:hypothetical protein